MWQTVQAPKDCMLIQPQELVSIYAQLDGMLMIRHGLANPHALMLQQDIFYKLKEDVCLNVHHLILPSLPKDYVFRTVELVFMETKLVVHAKYVQVLVSHALGLVLV